MAPPPVPSKSKPFSSPGPPTFSKPPYSTGTFPGKARLVGGHHRPQGALCSHSNTLPLPNKQESPPAAAVRPFTPDLSDAPPPVLRKPQTVAASSIYSMYTQQATAGKGQGPLPRSQPRGELLFLSNICSVDDEASPLTESLLQSMENQSSQQAGGSRPSAQTPVRWTAEVRVTRKSSEQRRESAPPLGLSAPPSSSPSSPTPTGAPATPTWRLCAAGCTTPPGP